MATSTAFAAALLDHLLQNAALANVGDAGGLQPSTAAGSLYLALHTADPTAAGNQSSSEATYTGYARQAIARSAAGFDDNGSGGQENQAEIVFPAKSGGADQTVTHWSVGLASSGAGQIAWFGTLGASQLVSNGVSVTVPIGDLDLTIT